MLETYPRQHSEGTASGFQKSKALQFATRTLGCLHKGLHFRVRTVSTDKPGEGKSPGSVLTVFPNSDFNLGRHKGTLKFNWAKPIRQASLAFNEPTAH